MSRHSLALLALCALTTSRAAAQTAEAAAIPARPDTLLATPAPPPTPAPMPPVRPARVAFVDSLKQPESALYDSVQNVWLVSNVNGPSAAKDGNGFITRIKGDGTRDATRWIRNGQNGVRLDAPKGMAIQGDTLWVADITVLRGFDRTSGTPVGTVDLAPLGALFLNDVAIAPDGTIYVTDTETAPDPLGLSLHPRTDRVFQVGRGRAPAVALETDRLGRPNGIAWDPSRRRMLIVAQGDSLRAWTPGTKTIETVATGIGQFDGIVALPDGRMLVSSWATGSVDVVEHGRTTRLIKGFASPADIGYGAQVGLLAVPLLGANRVEFHRIPAQ